MFDQPSAQEQFSIVTRPPRHVAQSLHRIFDDLRATTSETQNWRWTDPDRLHVTLAITPMIPVTDVGRLERALHYLKGRFAFRASMTGLGLFRHGPGSDTPQAIWADMDENGRQEFYALRTSLEEGFAVHGIPIKYSDFRPHMTLARPDPNLEQEVDALLAVAAPAWKEVLPWMVDSVSLTQRLTHSWRYIQNLSELDHEVMRFSLESGEIVERDEVMINGDLNVMRRDRISRTGPVALSLH